jgi:hypothetical protein
LVRFEVEFENSSALTVRRCHGEREIGETKIVMISKATRLNETE